MNSPRLARIAAIAALSLVAIGGLGVTGLAVAVVSTIALTPSFASDHHGHGTEAAAGHSHGAAADGGAAAGGHSHGAAIVSNAPVGDTPCEESGPPASAGQISSAGGHGHRGPIKWASISDRATRDQLGQQLEIAHQVTLQYPTVTEAEADGFRMVTGYVPCIGAHYTNVGLAGSFDPSTPSELLYDGVAPDSKIVGLSYLVYHHGGPPPGFAGPNDHWHQHNANGGLCLQGGLVVGGEDVSPQECANRGGRKVLLIDIWMMHAWVVPGFECSWGVFSGECPELGGRLGGTAWEAPDPTKS